MSARSHHPRPRSERRFDTTPHEYTLRSTGAVVTFWIGIVVVVILVGWPLVSGQWRLFGWVLAPALLLAWVLWIVLYRPSVRYTSERVVITNIVHRYTVPWNQVVAVEQRVNLVFRLRDGQVVNAAGVPYPRRPGNLAQLLDRRTRPEYDFDQNAALLEHYVEGAPPSTDLLLRRWEFVPLGIGAVLIAAVVIELAAGL